MQFSCVISQLTPEFFLQLYTIIGYKDGFYVPLAFVALENKEQLTYERMWIMLKDFCSDYGYTLNPSSIIVDFEAAPRNAIKNVFNNVSV